MEFILYCTILALNQINFKPKQTLLLPGVWCDTIALPPSDEGCSQRCGEISILPPSVEVTPRCAGRCRETTEGTTLSAVALPQAKTEGEKGFRYIKALLFLSFSQPFGWQRLGCRLGRCFCFAEVSTGHPHPRQREPMAGKTVGFDWGIATN